MKNKKIREIIVGQRGGGGYRVRRSASSYKRRDEAFFVGLLIAMILPRGW
jgi:hypothetical protein